MHEKVVKLIDVKSISTLTMVGVFCFLSIVGEISTEQFMTVFTTVIAFYFGTQATKREEINNGKRN